MAMRAPSGDSPSSGVGASSGAAAAGAVVLRTAPGPVAGAPPSPAAAAAAAAAAAGSAARAAAAQHMERLSAWKDSLVERLGRSSAQPAVRISGGDDDRAADAMAAGAAVALATSPAVAASGAAPGGPAAAAVAALTALLSRGQAAAGDAGLLDVRDGSSRAAAAPGCDSGGDVVRISRLHWRSGRGAAAAAATGAGDQAVAAAPGTDGAVASGAALALAASSSGAGGIHLEAANGGTRTTSSSTTSNILAAPAAALAAVARRARSLRLGSGGFGGAAKPASASASASASGAPRSPRSAAAAAASSSAAEASAGTGAGGGGGGEAGGPRGPTHLIVFANGLFGSPSNWTVICEQLQQRLDMNDTLLHPSQVNRRTDTYDGIDVCGGRLADEIRGVVAAHPSLTRISVVGHSLGGLLLRYAIGLLYSPASGRIAGLAPAHFLSLATPHCGCDGGDSVAQVPFIGWVPLQPVQKVLQVLSVPTAEVLFRRTGRQFFLADGVGTPATAATATAGAPATGSRGLSTSASPAASGTSASPAAASSSAATAAAAAITDASSSLAADFNAPLLYRLTSDDPDRGAFFYSALAAFRSRTAYANTDGDHLVGWANSSLRFMHQLPRLPSAAAAARGVVLQDPLLAAFDVRAKPNPEPQSATSAADVPVEAPPPAAVAAAASGRGSSSSGNGNSGAAAAAADGAAAQAGEAALAEVMLRRLQRLPWRRIDVSFGGAKWGLAHNNIQVTRRWMNFEGMAVAAHVAEQVVALEQALQQQEAGAAAVAASPAGRSSSSNSSSRPSSPPALVRGTAAAGQASTAAPIAAGTPHPEWRTQQPLMTAAAADAVLQEAAAGAAEATAVEGVQAAGAGAGEAAGLRGQATAALEPEAEVGPAAVSAGSAGRQP
ncbi:hypothetical protein HXX76_015057 [Chlamydomonas incerta]|uniref:DUF676 domain-containing protein n=1 Tax=Chlamydomonas incerta TaxID=51695 RepID=A0A835SDY7_CHLIN|nr:hypothetical protein HXX76_015057 [Chlamydomonas incerta]|eukprot:KAG2423781.1 hypothetical protein HXX76_015057 [Chlamydomonas incerta]